MPRGDIIARGIMQRIQKSAVSIDVLYPAVRPLMPGLATTTNVPVSPLTGKRVVASTVEAAAVPEIPPVTLQCLWIDATRDLQLTAQPRDVEQLGWVDGAHALATVLIDDAALDPSAPNGDTVFTACDKVVKDGDEFRVLRVTPIGAGFREPFCYAVWLMGAAKQ